MLSLHHHHHHVLLLLVVAFGATLVVDGVEQNMCGSNWSGATSCNNYCPGGADGECPNGERCFGGVDCPLAPTISPRPTRSPVKGFPIGDHDKQIIGYYASWQWYDRGKKAQPANMDFNKVTRVNYAFFQLDEGGNIWGTDDWADPRLLYGDPQGECTRGDPGCKCSWVKPQFKSCKYHNEQEGLVWQVHQARGTIYPSIGGWTLSDAFPPMAADSTSRAIFARNCRQLIEDYDFDGIDLDWEYPGYADHSGTPADKANFNLLLADIKAELDALSLETNKQYGLTAALPCGPGNIANIDIVEVSNYLTEFNLMSYDFHGPWDTYTGVNSPLRDQASDPDAGWSVDGCVKNWVEAGAPKEKLNIGLAFYGRSYAGAKELGAQHAGADEQAWEIDEGSPQYFNIIEKIDDMTVEWDDETKTPYAYFSQGGVITYDDERAICLKTEYAIEENLQGFIIWELSGDVLDDLNTPLLDILNRKLSVTQTNCEDPFGPLLNNPVVPDVVPTPATAPPISLTPPVPAVAPPTPAVTQPEPVVAPPEPAVAPMQLSPEAHPEPGVHPKQFPGGTEATEFTATAELPNTPTWEYSAATYATTTVASNPKITIPQVAIQSSGLSDTAQAVSSALEAANVESSLSDTDAQAVTFSSAAYDGRQRVQRNKNKPDKPYRPPKEQRADL